MSKKQLQGTIISLANNKTALVKVSREWQHPLYKKRVKRSKKYACHYDQEFKLAQGEQVVIEECRPVSKTKHFRVIKQVGKVWFSYAQPSR